MFVTCYFYFMAQRLFFLIVWILSFYTLPLSAQRIDLSQNLGFFQRKAERYQHWLEVTRLNQVLSVEKFKYKKDKNTGKVDFTELEFYLLLRTHDADSAVGIWRQAEEDYQRLNGQPLQEALFRTFTRYMEVPDSQANIQIYINDTTGQRIPCFFIWIWDERGHLMDSVRFDGCMAQHFSVEVPAMSFPKVSRNGKTSTIPRKMEPKAAFDRILQFARQQYPPNKYDNTYCSGRVPIVQEISRTERELVFSVSDLCREALTNSELSIWCEIARKTGWQKDCNDIRRERLVFTIKYIGGVDKYHLQCRLDGKFGSAAFVPRDNDYFDMDPDFVVFEKTFADQFQQHLQQYLSKW